MFEAERNLQKSLNGRTHKSLVFLAPIVTDQQQEEIES